MRCASETPVMSALTPSNISLPRKLERPLNPVLRILAPIYVVVLLLMAFTGSELGSFHDLKVVALWGGGMLLIFGVGVFFGWQSLTVFDDHLVFETRKTQTTEFYRDVSEVKPFFTQDGPRHVSLMLMKLYHRGEGKNPLLIDLQSFKARDQALLLELIKQNAPDATFNALAE